MTRVKIYLTDYLWSLLTQVAQETNPSQWGQVRPPRWLLGCRYLVLRPVSARVEGEKGGEPSFLPKFRDRPTNEPRRPRRSRFHRAQDSANCSGAARRGANSQSRTPTWPAHRDERTCCSDRNRPQLFLVFGSSPGEPHSVRPPPENRLPCQRCDWNEPCIGSPYTAEIHSQPRAFGCQSGLKQSPRAKSGGAQWGGSSSPGYEEVSQTL